MMCYIDSRWHTPDDLHKLRASHSQEWDLSLGSHSLGQQGLPTSRRPEEQRTLGNLGSQMEVSFWILTSHKNIVVIRDRGECKIKAQ